LVLASRWLCRRPLPERSRTTDLFHDVAKLAEARRDDVSNMLGATEATIELAVQRALSLYPRLRICGHSQRLFSRASRRPEIVAKINAAGPDILWGRHGRPARAVLRGAQSPRLHRVGIIKTSGGLFDFLSGKNRRAPNWMQAAGLEWAHRTFLEPQRLAGRYLMTNPHAAFLLLTRTRQLALSEREDRTPADVADDRHGGSSA